MNHQKNCMGRIDAMDNEEGIPETATLGMNIFETTLGADSERDAVISNKRARPPLSEGALPN